MIYTFLDPVKQELGKRLMTPCDGKFITKIVPPVDDKKSKIKEARLRLKAVRNARRKGGAKHVETSTAIDPSIIVPQNAFEIPEDAHLVSVQGILRGSGDVVNEAIERKIDWVYLDHGYLGKAHRVCLNETAPTTMKPRKEARFAHKIEPKSWKGGHGNDIVILPPSPFYTDQFGLHDFLYDTVYKIAKHSDRRIVVRPKPHQEIKAADLESQLRNAYCVVTWGSALALSALIRGIPVISTGSCPTKPVSFKFSDLETSKMEVEPDRMCLLNNLTWNLYDINELPRAFDIVMSNR